MMSRRVIIVALWLCGAALSALIVARASYITDLSAFLPAHPTDTQRLLVDQLRDGPASRMILVAIEGGDMKARAATSRAMATTLRLRGEFLSINNGEAVTAERDRALLFKQRYLLSETVTPQRFTAAGLESAIGDTLQALSSPEGLMLKSLVPRDPTGEMLQVIEQLTRTPGPESRDGIWAAPDGTRALLVAQTRAAGSDTDAQALAATLITNAFAAAAPTPPTGIAALRVHLSGPGIFAVAARAKIETAAIRLSVISSVLVVAVLLLAYRSATALLLGLLPVVTGAVVGIAAVAVGFGAVHGVTLGFGITLIGEAVDYSIYFFIQSRRAVAAAAGRRGMPLWSTIRLGVLTSVCGFAALLPAGFPGLAQLGLYSISGLLAAALVTRYVLPELLPAQFAVRDLAPFGRRLARLLAPIRRVRPHHKVLAAAALALSAGGVVAVHHATLWNRDLAALSPIAATDLDYDTALRADLGAADARDVVVISGPDLQSVLRGAERAAVVLQELVAVKVLGGFDTPATYLPSLAAQNTRRNSIPEPRELRANLLQGTAHLELRNDQLEPFLEDAEAARHGALLQVGDLQGTSLGLGFDAMILHQTDRWNAMLPLHAAAGGPPDIDTGRVQAALYGAGVNEARVLNLKSESDSLYANYVSQAIRLTTAGFAAIVVLLACMLRSLKRAARVLAPLLLAVLVVMAALTVAGIELTILHLVGLLLIVAVGSNYALFFDAHGVGAAAQEQPLTLASLLIANVCTVAGFGILCFSHVPVLESLGETVAPGALLALLFSASAGSDA